MKSIHTGFTVPFNVFVLVAALYVINTLIPLNSSPMRLIISSSNPPYNAILPHLTITPEMKADIFFDRLRFDYPITKTNRIIQSVNPWEPYILRYSKQYNIDSDLVRAIIYAESSGNPNSVSSAGAMGLMQIMPITAIHLGLSDTFDPEQNIRAGVKYIAWLVNRHDEAHALWEWNAGSRMVAQQRIPLETRRFIVKVLTIKNFLKDERGNAI